MKIKTSYWVVFSFIFLAAVWGASFMLMRIGVPEFGAYAFGGLRVGIASLVLLPILLKANALKEFKQHWLLLSGVGILSTGLPFMLFAFAAYELTAGTASVINASTPMITGVIAHCFFKEYLSKQQFIGLLIGMLGVSVLMFDGLQYEGISPVYFLAALAACLCYALGSNISKTYLSHISSTTIASSGLLAAGLATLPLVIYYFPDHSIFEISTAAWLSVVIIALFSTAIATVMFYKLIKVLDATRTVSITLLIPLFGIFWGVVLLDEVVTRNMMIGTAIILLGTSLAIFKRQTKNNEQ